LLFLRGAGSRDRVESKVAVVDTALTSFKILLRATLGSLGIRGLLVAL